MSLPLVKTKTRKTVYGFMIYAHITQTQGGKVELIGKMFFVGRILMNQKKIDYGKV